MTISSTLSSQERSPTLKQFRATLQQRVLDHLSHPAPKMDVPQIEDGVEWTIVCNVAPFDSADAADAAEAAIHWATDPESGEACRTGFAALELQRYLRRMRPGLRIRIITLAEQKRGDDPAGIRIELRRTICDSRLSSHEAFELRSDAGRQRIIVLSPSGVGLLYGVYELLQLWGVRFHGPGETHVPINPTLQFPPTQVHSPSFRIRMSYSFRRNRATPELLEWMGQNRLNLWGADNRLPGMYKRGIRLMSGNHDFLPVMGLPHNFCIHDERHRRHLRTRVVYEFSKGMWKDAEVIDYIGGDWAKRCECDRCREGNGTDVELIIVHEIRQAIRQAYEAGQIDRDLPIKWYAYFDTLQPPKLDPPSGFDFDHCFGAVWSMRCWIHFLNEGACNESMSRPHAVRDFIGQTMTEQTNLQIDEAYRAWNQPGSLSAGKIGIGQYYYNAGLFWLPIPYQAILAFEMPYYHRFNSHFIGMMHLAAEDWGPKSVTYGLWARQAWNINTDAVEWLADYYRVRYGNLAEQACRFYFGLEEMMANMYNQRRFVLPTLKNGWDDRRKPLVPYEHLNGTGRGEGNSLRSMRDRAEQLDSELKNIERHAPDSRILQDDRRWFDYAADAVRLLSAIATARNAYCNTGSWEDAGPHLHEAKMIAIRLHQKRLPITLPGKPRLTPYQSTGLVGTLAAMLRAAKIPLDSLADVPEQNTRIDLQPIAEQDPAEVAVLSRMLQFSERSTDRSAATDLPSGVIDAIRAMFRGNIRVSQVDIDQDGCDEFIVAGSEPDHMDRLRVQVVAIRADGQVVWQRSALEGVEPLSNPRGIDLDGDGYPEIVLLTSHEEKNSLAHLLCLEPYGGTHWDSETVEFK